MLPNSLLPLNPEQKKLQMPLAREAVRVVSELPGTGRWDHLLCKSQLYPCSVARARPGR